MHDNYTSSLSTRYASEKMRHIFSDDMKFSTWRRLWVALAEAEHELGLPVTQEQIDELRAHVDDIDYECAARYESQLRHDVMSHVHAYGDACPGARAIIHLGATSCYVGDNADIIIMREALLQIKSLLVNAIAAVTDFAEKYCDVPTLAYTHFQAAQPTTAGKRACLWAQDLIFDLEQLDFQLSHLRLLGCRGATGTAASFLALFEGDADKTRKLEQIICKKMGFDSAYAVSGQTYSRKVDYNVLSVLCGIAQSASKFATDLRLLAHLKEFDEPFTDKQIGSSAMAYKRNPMRCERICALSRFVMCDVLNPAITAATQWLERTLDDSANRRLSVSEAFLATDAILNLVINVMRGGTLYPNVMRAHLEEEMPFMVTENIMMYCVEKGADRQDIHEAIRRHSVDVTHEIKLNGARNDLLERIAADPVFHITREELKNICDSSAFTGLAAQQTRDFIDNVARPVLAANRALLGVEADVRV